MAFNVLTAQEAAEMIPNGATIGLSGFTAPGTPKFISEALAAKAVREHEAGREFKVNMFTGASTSDHVDGVMARANAYNMRAPYQNVLTFASVSTATTATISTVTCRKWPRKYATVHTALSTLQSSKPPISPIMAKLSLAAVLAMCLPTQ